ncbi:MAG: site-specific DNA-methyltransferase [Chloroflexi bacterium]|nr:site-specific DNA-methyltransferase [Chloroflexota bacterium]
MASGLSKTKWNGNELFRDEASNGSALDVTLTYEGKKPEETILQTEPARLQFMWEGDSPDNRLYYGDNLPILAALLNDQSVCGKVRLVYIDPPYATKSIFQSRALNDAYSDLLSGAHYLEFIRERLILLRELLAVDGSIYVHLDDNMAFQVKVIMDEVFGRSNFRNWITRKKCNPKNYTRKTYGNISDYILFYTKSKDYVWNRAVDTWTDEHAQREYTYVEEHTSRKYKRVPIHAPGERNGETGKPWRGMNPPPGKHWQYTPATLEEMDARGEIYWSPNGNPRRKIYLDESQGIPAQDIWLDFRDAHNQNIEITGYPTEKNPALIRRIIEASSNSGDLVLDCFSGSGTTLEVAANLGRNWIGIDSSFEAIATTLKRFAHGTEPMGDFVGKRTTQRQAAIKSRPMFQTTDFALSAPTSLATELADILARWRAWIG